MLTQISEIIVSNRSLEEILRLIVIVMSEAMGFKICSVLILDEEKNELVINATQSLCEEYRGKPNIRIGQSVSGRQY